jgi:phosphatidate cytidylyltransferase
MARRTITALLLLVLVLPAVYLGGFTYFAYLSVFIVVAAWEYVQLFRAMKFEPSIWITVGGTFALLAVRAFWPGSSSAVFTAWILAAMTVHLIAYERGRDPAALDFAITVLGLSYLGWIAAYMIDLRSLPNGGWWVMLVFPIVWLTDTGAYLVGVRYGRHKMLSRLSPKKSWEGFAGGVVCGTLVGGFLAFAYARFGPLHVSIWQGVLLGLLLSTTSLLGDLGESLFKRFANAKDSGSVLPGHGGAFDRIDSLIWGGVIGYYFIRIMAL